MTAGQIIIANSIQICEPEDPLNLSTTISSRSSSVSSFADMNNNEWQSNQPVVTWPAHLSNLVDQVQPDSSTTTMVMPMPQTKMFKSKHSSFKDKDYSYCGSSYCCQDDLTATTEKTTTMSSSMTSSLSHLHDHHHMQMQHQIQIQQQQQHHKATVKRVHFWDSLPASAVA